MGDDARSFSCFQKGQALNFKLHLSFFGKPHNLVHGWQPVTALTAGQGAFHHTSTFHHSLYCTLQQNLVHGRQPVTAVQHIGLQCSCHLACKRPTCSHIFGNKCRGSEKLLLRHKRNFRTQQDIFDSNSARLRLLFLPPGLVFPPLLDFLPLLHFLKQLAPGTIKR